MDIAITIEAAAGLNWARWRRLAEAVENAGYWGLFRSDHFVQQHPPDQDSLELWVSLTWLASHSTRLHFGPLVTPMTYRDPVMTARMALAVSNLSGGRLVLGLGAGGWEREHRIFGYPLAAAAQRSAYFKEAAHVIHRLMRSPVPVDFDGKYLKLEGAQLRPGSDFPGKPALLIGGMGHQHTLPLAAKLADECNGLYMTAESVREWNKALDGLLKEESREPSSLTRSMVTLCIYDPVQDKARTLAEQLTVNLPPHMRAGVVWGDGPAIRDRLAQLEAAGLQRIYLHWPDLDAMAGLGDMADFLLK